MIRALCLAMLLPVAAQAGSLRDCGEFQHYDAIAEPWETNSAVFAQGQVRLAAIDMLEPAAAAWFILVLSPPRDEIGGRQCRLVTFDDVSGFGNLDFPRHRASYDPAQGLTVTIPVTAPDPEQTGDAGWYDLGITIDQSTGEITLSDAR